MALGSLGSNAAAILGKRGAGLSRVLTKLQTGQNIKVTFIGDSGFEGNTATTPGTDDAASVVCSTLGTRFGVTVTKSNRAVSGYRAYSALDPSHLSPTAFTSALADASDLYVLSFGHNDIRSGASLGAAFIPGSGYTFNQYRRAVEHMIRRLRIDRPEADIMLTSEWQYTGTSVSSNTDLVTYNKVLRRLAAAYGCAWADFYGALATVGVTGSNATVDDVYIWPTGSGSAQHPKSAGHAVWAQTITDQLPLNVTPPPEAPVLPGPLFGAERYCHVPWVAMATATGAVRTAGTSGYRLIGTWAGTSTLPQTSTTAGDKAEFQICGHELAMRFDGTAGHIKIEVNGAVYNADLNLAAQGSGQNFYTLDLGPGIHRVLVTTISGSVTFRGADYAPTVGNRIPYTSALLTYTGTWTTVGAQAETFEANSKQTATTNDSITIEWVGTALWCNGSQYGSTTNSRGVTNDSGTEVVTDFGVSGGTTQQAGWLVTSGLTYGRHTTVIRQASAGRALQISSFLAYDETRTERPRSLRGLTISTESPVFLQALPGRPLVRLAADDATSTTPPYPTSVSSTGFTANGTAAARHVFEVETGRVAY